MSARQRSKTGCWTCRLRKKKCFEDGPPCTNCRQFGVLCHGYGPRPAWKDRGDLEKEEARKLRLHAEKPGNASSSSIRSASSTTIPTPSAGYANYIDLANQTESLMSYSPSQQAADADLGQLTEPQSEHVISDLSFPFDDDIWANGPSYDPTPYLPVSPPQLSSYQSDATLAGLVSRGGQLNSKTSEIDITLLMDFLQTTFCRQYLPYSHLSTPQKSWLLCLMLRSPTFFNTSLSMSAYFSHLNESRDPGDRESSFIKYQRHRDLATRSFNAMTLSPPSVHGEPIVCGVHLALLEALGNNIQSCQSYLRAVSQIVAEDEASLDQTMNFSHFHQSECAPGEGSTGCDVNIEPIVGSGHAPSSPLPSSMEQTAALFFTATFVWNDILCAAAETRTPSLETKFRSFLTEEAFCSSLREITGCEPWILSSIMDVTALEISKRKQLSHGALSMRDLVRRACEIEAALEHEIEKLTSHANHLSEYSSDPDQSRSLPDYALRPCVFGYAALIHLNTVVSGAFSGVPEIHHNISQAIPSWEALSAANNFKYLGWAYSTTASLAAPSQRSVFQTIMADLSRLDAGTGTSREFRSGVERCWKKVDRHMPNDSHVPCDWREMHQRENCNFIFL